MFAYCFFNCLHWFGFFSWSLFIYLHLTHFRVIALLQDTIEMVYKPCYHLAVLVNINYLSISSACTSRQSSQFFFYVMRRDQYRDRNVPASKMGQHEKKKKKKRTLWYCFSSDNGIIIDYIAAHMLDQYDILVGNWGSTDPSSSLLWIPMSG